MPQMVIIYPSKFVSGLKANVDVLFFYGQHGEGGCGHGICSSLGLTAEISRVCWPLTQQIGCSRTAPVGTSISLLIAKAGVLQTDFILAYVILPYRQHCSN